MMMVLLTVLGTGLLGISAIELRRSSAGNAMQRARDNARLAMLLALGEVQQHLGPDQRVCADASVALGPREKPAHPHWLSVWRTTREDGSPWIVRQGDKAGLADLRQSLGFEPSQERIACLVSGNEAGIQYRDDAAGADAGMALVVGAGSLGDGAGRGGQVRAPKVPVVNGAGGKGAYAWWVGDLGAAANVATRDPSDRDPERLTRSRQLAQDASWAAGGREIEDAERTRLISGRQLALIDPTAAAKGFHDFTTWSAGLQVNVRDGGWKNDLTAFLESDGVVPPHRGEGFELPGLADADNLVGPANVQADRLSAFPGQAARLAQVAPNFGLLRTWAQRAAVTAEGVAALDSELPEMVARPTGGRNQRSVDFRNRVRSHLMPVVAEGSIYYQLSYYDPAKPVAANPYALRLHYYPRVALWNPYNVALKVPESAVFLHVNGSKSVEVAMRNGQRQTYRMFWGLGGSATGGSVRGSLFFRMEAATLEPGEVLVWSPARNAAYDERNFSNNLLTPVLPPGPGRSFHQDSRADGYPLFQVQQGFPPKPGLANNLLPAEPVDWREVVPARPAGNLQSAAYTQADDYFVSWKPLAGNFTNEATFAAMPMGRFVSCAYQFGDEDELPVEWTALDRVPMQRTTLSQPVVTAAPDRRTRDGFRLRWLRETESNALGSGSLAGTPHLEDAPLANWNMRASWSFRNPFDNVTDVAPHFFGIYTRDLFDGEVDWQGMNPRVYRGRARGGVFDQPVRSVPRVLFDVPRRGAEIVSLGALQHANFSEFVWHPTYALGNSLADPRVPAGGTHPDRGEAIHRDKGGWNQDSLGYSTDGRSNNNGETNRTHEDNWAWHARNFLQQAALDQELIYDLSYEVNHVLWDGFFLSSGTEGEKKAFVRDPVGSPLPNGRMVPNPAAGPLTPEVLSDYHRAAAHLLVDGAFNVHSTSVAAWEGLLLSGMGKHGEDGKVAFPRVLDPTGGAWDGADPLEDGAWSGQRYLTREEIRRLAEAIVGEVRARGPFLGLADFVNRRLADGEAGLKGALQAAIDRAGINAPFEAEWPIDTREALPDYRHVDHIQDPTRMEQTRKPSTGAWGALGYLTQADLLQSIGPVLSARSDTFRIRACGEAHDASGKVVATAWCEAVVQRTPAYVAAGDPLLSPPSRLGTVNARFGRRFQLVHFRWLHPAEV